MSKARRTPPLFDVLGGNDRRTPSSSGSTPAGPVVSRPVQVRIPPNATAQPSMPSEGRNMVGGGPSGSSSRSKREQAWYRRPQVLFGISIAIALVAGAWYSAYHIGRDQAARDFAPKDVTQPAGVTGPGSTSTTGNTTVGPTGAPIETPGNSIEPPSSPVKIEPDPKPPATLVDVDPRKVGVNYLHIATLPWKDAEQAVAYLGKNGVRAMAVPAKKVDPKQARDKNQPHLIFALEGVPSEKYSASAKTRSELEKKVRDIGQKFQQKERGASDFAAPYWVSYTGK